MKLVPVALAVLLLLAPPASAATKYAAPDGSATNDCTATDPGHVCSIHKAVQAAASNDEVIALPGTYDIQATLNIDKRLTLRGLQDQPRPRLVGAAGVFATVFSYPYAATLRHLAIESQATGGFALHVKNDQGAAAILEDLDLSASGNSAKAALISLQGSESPFVFRDSVARTTGSSSTAVLLTRTAAIGPLNAHADVRNLTADARGPDSAGFVVGSSPQDSGCANLTVTAKNVIALGTRADVGADSYGGCPAILDTHYSNWRTQEADPGGSVNSHSGDQFAPPLFAAAASGDYHQLAGSPTIDAGVDSHFDSKLGLTDIDGQPRLFGSTTDIGADEYVPQAAAAPPPTGDTSTPALSGLRMAGALYAAPSGPSARNAAKKRRIRYGAVVSYRLSEPASVRFTVERPAAGRRVGRRCVAPRRSNRRARRCTRYVTLKGSFSRAGTAGANRFRFMGRLGGKKLRAGRYRLVARARDAVGNASPAARRAFRIRRLK